MQALIYGVHNSAAGLPVPPKVSSGDGSGGQHWDWGPKLPLIQLFKEAEHLP